MTKVSDLDEILLEKIKPFKIKGDEPDKEETYYLNDMICYAIGEWYLDTREAIKGRGVHNLGYLKERVKGSLDMVGTGKWPTASVGLLPWSLRLAHLLNAAKEITQYSRSIEKNPVKYY